MTVLDIIISAAVAAALGFAISRIVKRKSSGGCGCGCGSCPNAGACCGSGVKPSDTSDK